ncbi:MAG: hypothetical protein GY739_06145, partial [Mesoflavibacter sp.]|nr:hypothetical protein [Mesoflavibacter sp.]
MHCLRVVLCRHRGCRRRRPLSSSSSSSVVVVVLCRRALSSSSAISLHSLSSSFVVCHCLVRVACFALWPVVVLCR